MRNARLQGAGRLYAEAERLTSAGAFEDALPLPGVLK
jgi:hypothetical protein